MTKEAILQRISDILQEFTSPGEPPINMETSIKQMHIDSMNLTMFHFEIEEQFMVSISDEQFGKFQYIVDIVDYVYENQIPV